MPLEIVRNDITKMHVDAIVNAANRLLLGGGNGVDGCIHRAAGPELLAECRTLGGCRTGSAKITAAYRLPCKYVIHTVGPVWHGGAFGEEKKLISCYQASLALAKKHGCKTVAFPLISSGAYGYPKDRALKIAVDTICEFLSKNEMTVYIVIFSKLFSDITEYIDRYYVDPRADYSMRMFSMSLPMEAETQSRAPASCIVSADKSVFRNKSAPQDEYAPPVACNSIGNLDSLFDQLDAGFSETLLKLIDATGKKDSVIYKKANVDRKLFSKIRNNPEYKPSKTTAIAFAIALELDLDATRDLISRAGFALSRSSKFDVIIEYFIENKNYDIFEINEALFAFDQSLLGA